MAGYAARRLLAAIPVLFVVSFVTFGLIRLAPGDPVLIVLGGRRVSPELIDQLRERFGLTATRSPSTSRGWAGCSRATSGESYKLRQEVSDLILARLPVTVELVLLVGAAGRRGRASRWACYQARRRETPATTRARSSRSSRSARPVYFTAILGVLVFAVWLGVLPAFGRGGPTSSTSSAT